MSEERQWTIKVCPECDVLAMVPAHPRNLHGHNIPGEAIEVVPASALAAAEARLAEAEEEIGRWQAAAERAEAQLGDCPTCGSDDPHSRGRGYLTTIDPREPLATCPDPFHVRLPEPAPGDE